MALWFIGSGCGVQAGDETAAPDCGEIETMTDVKARMDALDRKIRDLRPSTVTPEAVRRLAPVYRDAASTFDGLLRKARARLAATRSSGRPADLTGAWGLMTESLELRRDGMQFYADLFAQPENLSQSKLEKGQALVRRIDRLNSRLQSSITQLLRNRDFEERSDGQFVIDC